MGRLRHNVAIVGAATTPTVRRADVPVGSLAVRATKAAIEDAGLTVDQIDGVACGSSLPAYGPGQRTARPGLDLVDSDFLIRHLDLQAEWRVDQTNLPKAFLLAIQAVAAGAATYVVVNRTLHNPSGRYHSFSGSAAAGDAQWTVPYGVLAPSSWMAQPYMEYQQRYGARREHMAKLAVQIRENVQRIPDAYFCGTKLTFEDYMSSRIISDPMCLYDNDMPVDTAGSFVITTAERAADLPNRPVYVHSWANAVGYYDQLPGTVPSLDEIYAGGKGLGQRLWETSGWRTSDLDVIELYDGFAPLVWLWLEVLGFCPQGQAWEFTQDTDIRPNSRFPLLTGGGNLGWGRLHGVPQMLECYLQLSGRAGERATRNAERAISTFSVPSVGVAMLYSTDGAT